MELYVCMGLAIIFTGLWLWISIFRKEPEDALAILESKWEKDYD